MYYTFVVSNNSNNYVFALVRNGSWTLLFKKQTKKPIKVLFKTKVNKYLKDFSISVILQNF